MAWEFEPTFDAAVRAAIDSGKPVIYVCAPAGWALAQLAGTLPPAAAPAGTIVVTPESDDATDVAAAIGWRAPTHAAFAATGLARAERLLRTGTPHTVVGSPATLLALAARSAVKPADAARVIVAWPESLTEDGTEALEQLLAETRGAQHLFATADEQRLGDLAARYAYRAPVAVGSRLPAEPAVGAVRYAVVDDPRREWAVREVLDILDPAGAILWDPLAARRERWASIARDPNVRVATEATEEPTPLAIATDLPSAEALAALAAAAKDVVVLLRSQQVSYLQALARPVHPLRLISEADRARDRAFRLRHVLRERLARGDLDAELLALAPLFDQYDPAVVAAAAAASMTATAEPAPTTVEAWAKVRVELGRRHRIRPSDVVGALLNSVGLRKAAVGKIDIRDGFTVIEIRAEDAEAAARGLQGLTLRGQSVTARLERR